MKAKLLTTALLLTGLLPACSSDDDTANGSGTALQVTSGIQTRAVDNVWESGDAIGIFMLNGTSTDTYINTLYTTTSNGESGTFLPASTIIYLPADGSSRDFIAYYPYQQGMSYSIYKIDLSDQSDQSAIDFLLAKKVTGKSRTDYQADFTFEHKLSKVIVHFKPGDGLSENDLAGTTVKLTRQRVSANFNVLTETEVVPSSGTDDIFLLTSADGTASEGIVFPNEDFGNMCLVIATPQMGSYTWKLSEQTKATNFKAGHKYIYTVTINRTRLEVTCDITDWEPGNGIDGDTGKAE